MSTGFRLATREDGEGILSIMESDVAKGDIGLLYTRRPNPMDSFLSESGDAVTGVFQNDGKTVGTISCLPRDMTVGGSIRRICYVTNMKRAPWWDGYLNWKEAFKKMYGPVASEVFFCSVVKENETVLRMLKKQRKGMPYAVTMDGYRTYLMSPTVSVGNECPGLRFRQAAEADREALSRFLHTWGGRRNLFPASENYDGRQMPRITDFYLLTDGGEIVSAGALWDRRDCKQYVVSDLSRKMTCFRLMNPVLSLLGYIRIPKKGSTASFTFLSFFLARDDREEYYRTFLNRIRKEVKKTHDILVLGTNFHNPKKEILDRIRVVTFDTELCEIVMSEFAGRERIPYDGTDLEIDCALL
jgi:hypothetical protein